MRSRREQEDNGSRVSPGESGDGEEIPRRNPRRRQRTLQLKGAEKDHGERNGKRAPEEQNGRRRSAWSVRSDRRIGKRQRAMKNQKKISHLSNGRTGDRMPMTTAPGTIHRPFRLVIHSGRSAKAVGKLTSHSFRESKMTSGLLHKRNAVS